MTQTEERVKQIIPLCVGREKQKEREAGERTEMDGHSNGLLFIRASFSLYEEGRERCKLVGCSADLGLVNWG